MGIFLKFLSFVFIATIFLRCERLGDKNLPQSSLAEFSDFKKRVEIISPNKASDNPGATPQMKRPMTLVPGS
jgi:hypothetical protein